MCGFGAARDRDLPEPENDSEEAQPDEDLDDMIKDAEVEQGKADGIKNLVNKSKNVETASRPQNNEDIYINGLKVRAVNGVDSSKLKIQKRNKN